MDGQEITQFTVLPSSAAGWTWTRSRARLRMGLDADYTVLAGRGERVRRGVGGRAGWSRRDGRPHGTIGEMMHAGERQWSTYGFDYADVEKLWEHLRLYEAECLALLERAKVLSREEYRR